ncbi:MAG: hypothetical protein CEN88_406 [Candidatus Berkelbacteria bacterium Licking1014_2]|uniref:Probable transcriptional regulatory protein CEN88_406 n=1 Tax=Candidatus Berkelbacteria bacterium Licking1014_2 TaxID=2017146 RepID=A0A554LT16_9BACT|nr:MAG: hypothetical protein CEN88_406 [Candidatus Berkelbacteria bacterium Licking1014_2]
MSGHNKWSQIKYKKAITDSRKGKVYSKLSVQISLAAKKGVDPDLNSELRQVIDKAREAGMAKENIERAVKRGSGQDGKQLEEISYEAYGPFGIAIIIDVITDNRNRAISDIKSLLNKFGGKLADSGGVSYLFEKKAVIKLIGNEEKWQLAAIEAGAEDIEELDGDLLIYVAPSDFQDVKNKLSARGGQIESAEIRWQPKEAIELPDDKRQRVIELLKD